uniref:Uncharacterized protein n=1 Tax=Arundo donax TaxID=35708 RepID=A0A0A9GN97_ARUDO
MGAADGRPGPSPGCSSSRTWSASSPRALPPGAAAAAEEGPPRRLSRSRGGEIGGRG